MSGRNALSTQANWRAWHCDFVIYPVVDITWFETLVFDAEVNIHVLIITADIPLFLLEIFILLQFMAWCYILGPNRHEKNTLNNSASEIRQLLPKKVRKAFKLTPFIDHHLLNLDSQCLTKPFSQSFLLCQKLLC